MDKHDQESILNYFNELGKENGVVVLENQEYALLAKASDSDGFVECVSIEQLTLHHEPGFDAIHVYGEASIIVPLFMLNQEGIVECKSEH